MKNSLNLHGTLLGVCVVAALLAACSSGGGSQAGLSVVPGTPLAALQGRYGDDDGPANLYSGGADSPVYIYSGGAQTPAGPELGSIFKRYGGGIPILYCVTGSAYGVEEFTGQIQTTDQPCAAIGKPPTGFGSTSSVPDLVGSDNPLTSAICCTATTPYGKNMAAAYGQPFEFPAVGVPIAFGYGSGGVGTPLSAYIRFSTWTYCAIANGTISNWDDPAITKDNGGKSVTGGQSQPITFFYRSDDAMMTYVFQFDLNAYCKPEGGWRFPYDEPPYQSKNHSANWTYGASLAWKGPGSAGVPNANFIGESGNLGVAAAIQATPYGIGYLAGAYAKNADPPINQAALRNGNDYVSPKTVISLRASLSGLTANSISYGEGPVPTPSASPSLGSSTKWCQLYIAPKKVVEPANSYPIVMLTYVMFYGANKVGFGDKSKLVRYMTGKSGESLSDIELLIARSEYAPVSEAISSAIYNAYTGSAAKKEESCIHR
jgi:ABC-type phosphate transport system substrate-binding protein